MLVLPNETELRQLLRQRMGGIDDRRVAQVQRVNCNTVRNRSPDSEDAPLRAVVGPPADPGPARRPIRGPLFEDAERPRLGGGPVSFDDLRRAEAAVEQIARVVEFEERQIIGQLVAGEGTPGIRERGVREHRFCPVRQVGEDLGDGAGLFAGEVPATVVVDVVEATLSLGGMEVLRMAGLAGTRIRQVGDDPVGQHLGEGAGLDGVERVEHFARPASDQNVDRSGASEVAVGRLQPVASNPFVPDQQGTGEHVIQVDEPSRGVGARPLLAGPSSETAGSP